MVENNEDHIKGRALAVEHMGEAFAKEVETNDPDIDFGKYYREWMSAPTKTEELNISVAEPSVDFTREVLDTTSPVNDDTQEVVVQEDLPVPSLPGELSSLLPAPLPEGHEPTVDTNITKLIEKHRTEQHAARMRLVGLCNFCHKEVLAGERWVEEKLIYNPINVELTAGLFHQRCVNSAYRQLTMGLIYDIRGRDAGYNSAMRMYLPKEDDAGVLPRENNTSEDNQN